MVKKGPKPKPFSYYTKTNEDGCWIWQSTIAWRGYGLYSMNRKRLAAHRASWIIHKGEIPDGLFVLHKCDVRTCVNPDHLFLGTQKDNMQDCIKKGRYSNGKLDRNHCINGHEFTMLNTRFWNGARICKTCDAEKTKRYRQRRASSQPAF